MHQRGVCGFLSAVVWVVAFKAQFYDLYEMWPGFVAGFAATIGVSLMTAPQAAHDGSVIG